MSRTYEQLEPVISALDERISVKAEQINALDTRVTSVEDDVSDLTEDLSDIATVETYNPVVDLKDYPVTQGYLNASDGSFTATSGSGSYQRTTDPITLDADVSYTVEFSGHSGTSTVANPRAVCVYRNDNSYSRYIQIPSGLTAITLTGNESYIRINHNAQTVDTFNYHPTGQTEPVKEVSINDDVEIPQVSAVQTQIDAIGTRLTAVEGDVGETTERLSQISETVNPCIIDMNTTFMNGYLDGDGAFVPTSNTQWTTDYVEAQISIPYKCDINITLSDQSISTVPRAIHIYKADKTLSRKLSMPAGINFVLKSDEKYIRLNYNAVSLNSLAVYPKIEGSTSKIVVTDMSEIKTDIIMLNDMSGYNYIHARRPIIAFILDGIYDLNATMENVFSNHNYKVGFAPTYVSFTYDYINGNYDVYKDYLDWQKKGHEILSHLTYNMREDSTYTDAQIIEFIKTSADIMHNVGFDVKGAIGLSGKVADKFIPYIQQSYSYAATENNHAGSATPILDFLTDNPYHLWRYSMQTSTPQEQQDAIDTCISNNGLLIFYGHANSENNDYFTAENLETLLTYIDVKVANHDCFVKTPFEAVRDFYSLRYDDYIALLQ